MLYIEARFEIFNSSLFDEIRDSVTALLAAKRCDEPRVHTPSVPQGRGRLNDLSLGVTVDHPL